ncbi:hypothetical protein [Cupriavidus sp.]|uniref:hypothetical protein n=1 Tax=Cupriavidus sp. TaxID=1873897 RepID=UPI0025C3D8C2|nr:hypothetical protein [Cupriavidus sp.]MCA3182178.1 hypothetical protein [Cupriavidus sp.]MCA3189872.1 hypothetical protein [Cupriavidus sp.]MCA3196771.1 hypothetical protein [Cupriavidus sp.]MCA3204270.1 hypothetical protein [Cupriavidus sp.]MCA3208299.1 hypothetical protein [Cupriavidus sp.]
MKIPSSFAFGMQTWLEILADHCYCAHAFTTGFDAESDADCWQVAVDTIQRFLMCELIYSPHITEYSNQEEMLACFRKYTMELADKYPFSCCPVEMKWFEFDLCGTEFCRELLRKHGLYPYSSSSPDVLCPPFIEELEDLFEKNGVGWRDAPLIKIRG